MRSRTEKLALSGIFCALALILSYVEVLIPFELIVPVPGFKPGLANVAVMAAMFSLGPVPALMVSLARITLSAVLFGSPVSFFFSLSGGIFSYLSLILCYFVLKKFFGCVGLSVLSAASHNIGQCLCAAVLYGKGILLFYLPYILFLSLITGTVSGIILYYVLKFTFSNKTQNAINQGKI